MNEIEVLNKFLKNHTFRVEDPFHFDFIPNSFIEVKMKILGMKNLIRVGEPTDFLTYEVFITDSDSATKKIIRIMSGGEKSIQGTDVLSGYYRMIMKLNEVLENFFKYFGTEKPVLCVKITDDMSESITESIITEEKYDSLTRQIVRDIISIYKKNPHGNYILPTDVDNSEEFYSYKDLDDITVELEITPSDEVEGYELETNFYPEEDVIQLFIIYNPQFGSKIIYDLIGDLNDVIRHELQHAVQQYRGDDVPTKEPKSRLKYYTQPHEIDAQRKGFRRMAKIQKRPLEQVVRLWFNKNRKRHGLKDKEIEIVIDKILQ